MERCEWLERATAQRSKLKQLELVAVWYWLFLSWRVSADPGSLEVPNRELDDSERAMPIPATSATRGPGTTLPVLAKSGVSVPGGNLQSACSGFKTLGQCVSAMHVVKNLEIPVVPQFENCFRAK